MTNIIKHPPFLIVKDNTVLGLSNTDRQPMYENEMCQEVGLIACCNNCDRVIFEDENYKEEYISSGGYCKECNEDSIVEEPETVYTTNRQWPLFDKAMKAVQSLNEGYRLEYTRPAGEQFKTFPATSNKYPSFGSNAMLKGFQLIWNNDQPDQVFINHGYPDCGYDRVAQALIDAGFDVIYYNPNKFNNTPVFSKQIS